MRRSIHPPGLPKHKNPIPAASILRGVFVSSAISGLDPETDQYPLDKEQQIALAFSHFEKILAAGGASADDVIKLDLNFVDKTDRALVNPHWLRLFPDENSRPARHSHIAELPKDCIFQITFMAVVERSDS